MELKALLGVTLLILMGLMGESETTLLNAAETREMGGERIPGGAQSTMPATLVLCWEPPPNPCLFPSLGAYQGRFPTSWRMVRSNVATDPQVPDVDLRLRSEQDCLSFHMANSRNVSKVALIPRPQVPQGRVVDSGGCYNVVGAGETEKPREASRSPAHFEHGLGVQHILNIKQTL